MAGVPRAGHQKTETTVQSVIGLQTIKVFCVMLEELCLFICLFFSVKCPGKQMKYIIS